MIYEYAEDELIILEQGFAFVSNFKNSVGSTAAVTNNKEKTRAINELSQLNICREELIRTILREEKEVK